MRKGTNHLENLPQLHSLNAVEIAAEFLATLMNVNNSLHIKFKDVLSLSICKFDQSHREDWESQGTLVSTYLTIQHSNVKMVGLTFGRAIYLCSFSKILIVSTKQNSAIQYSVRIKINALHIINCAPNHLPQSLFLSKIRYNKPHSPFVAWSLGIVSKSFGIHPLDIHAGHW